MLKRTKSNELKYRQNLSLTTKLANTNPNSHTHRSSKSQLPPPSLMTLFEAQRAKGRRAQDSRRSGEKRVSVWGQLPGGGVGDDDGDDASLRRRRRLSSAALGSPSSSSSAAAAAPSSDVWNSVSGEAGSPSAV